MTDWGLIDPGAADSAGTDDDAVLAAMVEVERGLLRAWGSVLGEPLDAAAAALDAASLDRAALQRGVARDGVPVVALVPALQAQLSAAGFVTAPLHLGATSQDIVDSTLMLVARDALHAARRFLVEDGRRLSELAQLERHSPRIARSLARQAEASTLGVLAAGWLDGVASAVAAIDAVAFPVQFGGAVGTGTAADAAAPRPDGSDAVRAELASLLGLADPDRSWHTERTPVLAVASAAAAVVSVLGRIAGDATFLSREEIGEVRLAGGGGSSAMAHKRNPVDAVAITAAATEAPGLVQVIAAAAMAGDERSAGRWHAEWASQRRLVRLARSAASSSARLLAGLEFDRERAAELLEHAGAAGERPSRDVLVAASDRIVDRAVARFARLADQEPHA
ncbi:lyase family protein [Agromyces cerinus]|uniref:3-carboxy-cis,cis-muconate cycloisomerase n=1 Tax=Agromyces cerinus subsp. cerinus TaxID=232089 RepID=A0A1N6HJ41_9MICO|nr:lyase family protein [Agromyces cerinus]SIO19894.1 3-carboxy-cis,cis-muconate cycloisomerase [Agromyces cerinus subsp. cerinus]